MSGECKRWDASDSGPVRDLLDDVADIAAGYELEPDELDEPREDATERVARFFASGRRRLLAWDCCPHRPTVCARYGHDCSRCPHGEAAERERRRVEA